MTTLTLIAYAAIICLIVCSLYLLVKIINKYRKNINAEGSCLNIFIWFGIWVSGIIVCLNYLTGFGDWADKASAIFLGTLILPVILEWTFSFVALLVMAAYAKITNQELLGTEKIKASN